MGKSTQTRLPTAQTPVPSQASLRPIFSAIAILAVILASTIYLQSHVYLVFSADVYLPIHYFVEITSIVISFSVFAVYWNATKEAKNARGLFLGTVFLAVAWLDAMHTLSFPGMPDFVTPSSVDKGILYWLSARIWTGIALVAVTMIKPQTSHPLLRHAPLLALNFIVIALVFVTVSFFSTSLPPMFIEDQGLTPLKIGLEYLVALLAVIGALFHERAYRKSGDQFFQRIAIALVATTFSELCFTFYGAAYDTLNLLGHLYKVVAYCLIFDALTVSAVRQPYAEIQSAFRELDVKNRELEKLNDAIENHLKRTIVELRQTAQTANQRAAQLNAIIDNLTEGVILATGTGELLRYNPAALAMAGFKSQHEVPRRIEGLTMLRFSYPDGRPIPIEQWPITRALRGDRFVDYEVVLVGNDCMERSLVYSGAPIINEEGKIVLAVTVSRDVSEERELSRIKDEFFLIASHHLKTPLTSVKGFAQLLVRRLARLEGHDEDVKGLEAINNQVDSMHGLIEKLLDVTRIQSNRFELHKESFDLGELTRDVIQAFQSNSEKHLLRFSLPDAVIIYADRHRIKEVLDNLISNAIKYSPDGKPVDIAIEAHDGQAVTAIRDYGAGIPRERQRFIFQQFYRAASSPFTEGMGLGLYVTRGIVEAHGGRIWFESPPKGPNNEPQQGSAFYFSLPSTPLHYV